MLIIFISQNENIFPKTIFIFITWEALDLPVCNGNWIEFFFFFVHIYLACHCVLQQSYNSENKLTLSASTYVLVSIIRLLYSLCFHAGLSFTEAERRLKENGPNVPVEYRFPSWWHLLWTAFFHPFNIILIILSALSYLASDNPNGCIMLVLVFISVSLRFYQVYVALFVLSNWYHIFSFGP